MIIKYKYTFLTFILFVNTFNLFSQKNWKETRYEDGIRVYMRNSDKTDIKEVLVETKMKATLSALVSIVKDSDNNKNWIYATANAEMLKEISDFEWLTYNESEAPWPIDNRDLSSRHKLTQFKNDRVHIRSIGEPDYIPEKKGIVRIPLLDSSWDFKAIDKNHAFVKFRLLIDLGGSLPSWLVNMAIDNGPFNTIKNMSSEVQKSMYKNSKLHYINDMQ